ncbi:hypothetical protein LCGC14_0387560 [marine sediment metagenome]|uniref:Uncharacterized protein n=1 Tax=marine sediment metagenome TaxID=412755 RepID=A0A0F9T654_9ZZZZ
MKALGKFSLYLARVIFEALVLGVVLALAIYYIFSYLGI